MRATRRMRWLRLLTKQLRVTRAQARALPLDAWIRASRAWRVRRRSHAVAVDVLGPLPGPTTPWVLHTREISAAEALEIFGGDRVALERHTGVYLDDDGVSHIVP